MYTFLTFGHLPHVWTPSSHLYTFLTFVHLPAPSSPLSPLNPCASDDRHCAVRGCQSRWIHRAVWHRRRFSPPLLHDRLLLWLSFVSHTRMCAESGSALLAVALDCHAPRVPLPFPAPPLVLSVAPVVVVPTASTDVELAVMDPGEYLPPAGSDSAILGTVRTPLVFACRLAEALRATGGVPSDIEELGVDWVLDDSGVWWLLQVKGFRLEGQGAAPSALPHGGILRSRSAMQLSGGSGLAAGGGGVCLPIDARTGMVCVAVAVVAVVVFVVFVAAAVAAVAVVVVVLEPLVVCLPPENLLRAATPFFWPISGHCLPLVHMTVACGVPR